MTGSRRASSRAAGTSGLAAQDALLGDLLSGAASSPLPVQQVLDLAVDRLAELGPVGAVLRAPGTQRADGPVLAQAGEARPGPAVPVRLHGALLGALTLTAAVPLRPVVVQAVAHHLAVALHVLAEEQDRSTWQSGAQAFRRLFEEGAAAATVDEAGEVLARVTAQALRTERAAVHLVDDGGRIRHVSAVGLPSQLGPALQRALVGRTARDSPVWRRTQAEGGPVLVDDGAGVAVRPGGFVQTMELQAYVALPLLSGAGCVGMAVCGDTRPRAWTAHERDLARQLALEGALVLDSARLRQAERRHLAEVTRLAYTDALTGLPNRTSLLDQLAWAVRDAERPAALLLLDLDGFKQVNDTLGHAAGDLLLHQVAQRLVTSVQDRGTVARLGGDELAVLVTGEAHVRDAGGLAALLAEALRHPFEVEGVEVHTGASVGLARFPESARDVAGLLRAADEEMYRAKRRLRPAG